VGTKGARTLGFQHCFNQGSGLKYKINYWKMKNKNHLKINNDWWKHAFGNLYLITDARSVNDQVLTKKEVDFIIRVLKVKKKHLILDLCCGHGRHSLELAKRGYRVKGLDYSQFLLEKAKTAAKKQKLTIEFRQGDARNLPYKNKSFERIIMMGNSFGYSLNSEDDKKILQEVYRVLKDKGKFLLDITSGEYVLNHLNPVTWHKATNDLYVLREKEHSQELKGIVAKEIVLSAKKGLVNELNYFERLYTQAEISQLLEENRFKVLEIHHNLTSKKENLGFMTSRLMIVSQKV